jgi:hypothetical protein
MPCYGSRKLCSKCVNYIYTMQNKKDVICNKVCSLILPIYTVGVASPPLAAVGLMILTQIFSSAFPIE